MALGRARHAAGETLTCKSGLPELAPLLSTRSPVSPHFSPPVAVRRSCRRRHVCGNDQCRSKDLCVLTSAALPSTGLSSPLHAPFTPSTPGSQVPGVASPCSPLHQVRGGVFPSRGNASKTWASLPQATVEQNRRELVTFCQQCWQFTNFRHNKGEIGILPLMVRLLIDTYRTAEHRPGRLRGELTGQKIKKYVATCLKPGKSTGPDKCSNEITKTMTDEEFQIVKM